ncbi:MAG: vitamin B12 dependent-methionine synthase activation domain-containing protein, partial [Longimicrobiales bacterium]
PEAPGIHVIDDVPVADLRAYIDWTPFLKTWELHGAYPAILDDDVVGAQARSLLNDAAKLLEEMAASDVLQPRAIIGLFPACSDGDDVQVFEARRPDGDTQDPPDGDPIATIHTLRQQFAKDGRANLALSDFVAPAGSVPDWVGAFAVTAGGRVDELAARFEAEHDDYHAIMAKALADRIAEALAEYVHERVRTAMWGYAAGESLENDALIAEAYRGIRPAPGYPACPDHTEKRILFDLLGVEDAIGITLTESFAMAPGASVSGWYFSHPDARYFGVGRLGRDQVEDYATRKGWSVGEAEQWLAPNLGYRPGETP